MKSRDDSGTIRERLSFTLSREDAGKVEATLEEWQRDEKIRRLWARDASLWTGQDEADWLGWLWIAQIQLDTQLDRLQRFADEVTSEGFSNILLLGMGGSSLCPEVLKMTFGRVKGFPELHVVDSTDPAQIRSFEEKVDLESTLFIVASKSGTTLESSILMRYFFERVKERLGAAEAGLRFVAITDPDSKLEQTAERDGFSRVFHGMPSIGGRYSALSNFGLVPATAMGLDLKRLLERTSEMVEACASEVPVTQNPGAVLGVILGVLGRSGRDKVTLVISPPISDLGAWLEQLIAESTGKKGVALIPVDGEAIAGPDNYGDDRLFVYVRLASGADRAQDSAIANLEAAGHPVVRIDLPDVYDLGQEFFRWEIATAVAGSVLGINPFNQPDVEASKAASRALTNRYEKTGELPQEPTLVTGDGLSLFANERYAASLTDTAGDGSVESYLRAHLDAIRAGDYLALLAYIEMNEPHREELQRLRHRIRDERRVATCLGFGPRYLHSTGQAYKGGPNSGVFLQITCDDAVDVPVPGQKYTFGIVKAAQARGDFDVLAERERRALRVHVGSDVQAGLKKLAELVDRVLG
ncbi:MAG: bifunctional transaldolase/phosoglucose isomerase [Gemmatimonadales bacterium]|jgi:glucose-6-phosphate isomerase